MLDVTVLLVGLPTGRKFRVASLVLADEVPSEAENDEDGGNVRDLLGR